MQDKDNNILSFRNSFDSGNQRSRGEVYYRHVIDACRNEIESDLRGFLEDLQRKIDDTLYRLSDTSLDPSARIEFFGVMREFRVMRGEVARGFLRSVLDGYQRFWRQAAEASKRELELVEQDDLEETLALEDISARAEKEFHDEIDLLNRRFSYMLGGVAVAPSTNPVAPTALAHAFAESLIPLKAELRIKLIVYKQFSEVLERRIGALYAELNSRLRHADVLPDLVAAPPVRAPESGASGRSADRRQTAAPRSEPAAEPVQSVRSEDSLSQQADTYATLQALLHQFRSRQTAASDPATAPAWSTAVERSLLMRVLSEMQRANEAHWMYGRDRAAVSGASIKRNILKYLVQATGRSQPRLSEGDRDIVDMVGMLFDFVLEEKTLPEAMKSQLARLQVPMLKLALIDQGFFRQKGHPARQLLNRLAQLVFTWTDDGDRSESSIYGRVESLIGRILSEFTEDTDVFTAVNAELSMFMEREQQSARMAEERTRQVSQGKEQLLIARRRVEQEIQFRLGPRSRLPEVVQALLRDGWKDVLLLTYLRQGPDSSQWNDAVALIDRLLWSVESKPDPVERKKLLSAIPSLLSALREGLSGISYDKNRMNQLFKELQAVHIKCLQGAAAESEVVETELGDLATAVAAGSASFEEDEFGLRAKGLAVGTWMEIRTDDGHSVRAKLSWRGEGSDVYVFVNRKGVKVQELDHLALAAMLRSGRARVLETSDVPLVERALARMMNRLREGLED